MVQRWSWFEGWTTRIRSHESNQHFDSFEAEKNRPRTFKRQKLNVPFDGRVGRFAADQALHVEHGVGGV